MEAGPEDPVSAATRACQFGEEDVLRQLLEPHDGLVHANSRDKEDVPLAHWAAINGRDALVGVLLEHGAEPNAVGGVLKEDALQWAARQGHLQIVSMLLDAGADPRHPNVYGQNSLHLAAQFGHLAVCLLLLAHGVPATSCDEKGFTPMMYVAKLRAADVALVRVLGSYGGRAAADARDRDEGNNALHWAVLSDFGPYAFRALISQGADVHAKNGAGMTPAELAKSLGKQRPARFLEQEERLAAKKSGCCGCGGAEKSAAELKGGLRGRVSGWLRLGLPLALVQMTALFASIAFLGWWGLLAGAFLIWITIGVTARVMADPANLYALGLVLASIALIDGSFATYLGPVEVIMASVTQHALVAAMLWAIWRVAKTDPGRVKTDPDRRDAAVKRLAAEGRLSAEVLCTTCLVEKPPRSKHCEACDSCILRFDHHCPFVANCVGLHNHRLFVVFLLVTVATLAHTVYQFYHYAGATCSLSHLETAGQLNHDSALAHPAAAGGDAIAPADLILAAGSVALSPNGSVAATARAAGEHIRLGPFQRCGCVFKQSRWLGCIMLLALYHLLWTTALLLGHLKLALTDQTTYEAVKQRRWVDPSTAGKAVLCRWFCNAAAFFGGHRTSSNSYIGSGDSKSPGNIGSYAERQSAQRRCCDHDHDEGAVVPDLENAAGRLHAAGHQHDHDHHEDDGLLAPSGSVDGKNGGASGGAAYRPRIY